MIKQYIKLIFLFMIIFSLIINGCSTGSRPEGVSEEIYNKTISYLDILIERREKTIRLSENESQEIYNFIVETSNNPTTTEKEKEILKKLLEVTGSYTLSSYFLSGNGGTFDNFDNDVKELKVLLNLR